jgi:transcriptional regulator with GAF, ATPase, and Fis domain
VKAAAGMRDLLRRLHLTRGSLTAGAVLLTIIPAAMLSRRLGRGVDHQDLWPAAQATVKALGGWIGDVVTGLVGVVLARGSLDLCRSPGMRAVSDVVDRVARTEATVVLLGESGVGKEVVARTIHDTSPRRRGPFVKVNCAAVPAELLESEFFGHEKGAFTHAHAQVRGHFERAHGGTLFLDEITELPLGLQAKLLHVLQDGEFYRVGGTERVTADVRVIAATNRDLAAAVHAGEFREDLYYRLDVVEVRVPPLRERREELPALVDHFRERCEKEYGRRPDIGDETMQLFARHDWPGNVRELETMVRRIAVLGSDAPVREELAARLSVAGDGGPATLASPSTNGAVNLKAIARDAARGAERAAIVAVLERVQWNRTRAAQILGVSYRGLLYKLAELNLTRSEERAGADSDDSPAA